MLFQFDEKNFTALCDKLARKDKVLKAILKEYSYPPYWTRPNSYETLVLTILEQQVSLASAFAAYKKLKEKIDPVTPEALLALTDEELRASYFTRQKIVYTRELAKAIISGEINLQAFEAMPDDEVRSKMIQLKGIGNWTIDIYLLHALMRSDIFPLGDIALVNSIKWLYNQPGLSKEELLQLGEQWRPYRSIATMLFWHHYIRRKNLKVLH